MARITYRNKQVKMIVFKKITPLVRLKKMKLEKRFLEMLTATVSHDMRTPLNAITGLSTNLQNFVMESGQKLLKIVHNSSRILLFLVNDLLDFFQMKNGKFNLNLQPTDVRHSVADLLEMFTVTAAEKEVQLIMSIDESVPTVLVIDE